MDGGTLLSISMGGGKVDLGADTRTVGAVPMGGGDDGGESYDPFNELTYQRRPRHEGDQLRKGEVPYDMNLPAAKCGLIIGRNGDTIRNLQSQASVRMHMVQTSPFDGYDKPLRIIGTAENVKFAEKLCQELMDSRDDDKSGFNRFGHSGGDDFCFHQGLGVVVVRGRDHRTRRRQHPSHLDADRSPNSVRTRRRSSASSHCLHSRRQRQRCRECRSNGARDGGPVLGERHVDDELFANDGRRWSIERNEICAESGCAIRSCREGAPDEPYKTFLVTGDDRELDYAQRFIRDKVGDIMVNAASVSGGGSSRRSPIRRHHHHHHVDHSPFSSSWSGSAAGNNGYSGGSRSNVYDNNQPNSYRQPLPQQQQQHHQALQQHQQVPQQQPSMHPTCNHSGQNVDGASGASEADYSLHWAAYYRSQGMHDTALAVENQYYARQSYNPQQREPYQEQ